MIKRYGELGDKPLVNQPTPTTSTVGYLGQVTFDISGNEWKCIKVDGSTYYWALPSGCYPDSNQEYVLTVCDGIVIYKKRLTGVLGNSGVTTTFTHGITQFGISQSISPVLFLASTQESQSYYNSGTGFFWAQRIGDNITLGHPSTVSFFGKPFAVMITYTKAV